MLNKLFLSLLTMIIVNSGFSQSISLINNQTATTLANRLAGTGVTVSGASLSCNTLSNGLFANINPFPSQSLAIDSGIVLCTGRVLSTAADTGINATRFRLASNNMGVTLVDPQITSIAGASAVQKDLCYLQFNFIPKGDSAYIDYTFASEDYPEYACSQFIDAFGIFVSPPSGTYTNYAKVPGTNINVSINSINDTTKQTGAANYVTYCTSLGAGSPFIQYYVPNSINNHIVYDGMTTVLKARFPVQPNQSHTMKIAIADILDANFDSGVFLKQYSFVSPSLLEIIERKSTNGLTTNPLYLIEGCNAGTVKFSRSSVATAVTVNVAYSGTATSPDFSGTSAFTIATGSSTYTYNINALLDGLTEVPESLKITFTCPALGFTDSAVYTIKDFANGISVFNTSNDTTICNNSSIALGYTSTDATYSSVWTPAANLSCTSCVNPNFTASNGNTFSTQTVNLSISAAGCTTVDSPITINIQPKPNISMAPSYSICKGDSVTINAFGSPAGAYTYLWTPSLGLSATNISNPSAKPSATQIYKVKLSSTAGCKDSLTTTVNVSNIRSEIDSIRKTNTTCGTSNGNISLYPRTAVPFNPPYQYSINGGTSFVSTNIFNGLPAGVYNVAIKNAINCRFDTILTITSGASAPAATFVTVNTSCGLNNGSATVTSKSGKAPLTLTWKLGATIISTDTFINNKASGLYTLVVTDSGGCVTQYAVNILSSTPVTVFFSKNDQTCGFNNGAVIASPTGGIAPYTYVWNTGAVINSISGLTAGTYKLTLTDGNGCIKIDSTTLLSFPAIVHSKSKINSTCGLANGSATAIVSSGGTPPFVYTWSNGVISPSTTNTSHTVSGLSAGTYFFTILDSKGCTKIDSVSISTSVSVSITLNKTNAICGNPNGSITTNILTGTPTYSYIWNDGVITQNRASIPIGTYTVTVTDINGCSASQSTTLTTNSSPSLVLSKIDATCGKNNGRMFSALVGAKPPIVYAWSNGKTSNFIDSLAIGIYTLTITDSNGCQKIATDTIKMIPYSNFNDTVVQTTCGNNNGSITLTNISGIPPITIAWADGSSANSRTGLAPGTYTVNVQDGNGCLKTKSFVISASTLPVSNFVTTNAMCANTVGSILSGATSGVSPYTYLWSSGETTANITNKPKGFYTVTITDSKGCIHIASDSIRRKPSPTYKDTSFKARCGISNGWINILNLVGTGPVVYTWSHDITLNSSTVGLLSSNIYFLTITDANGCQVKDTFDLTSNGPISFTYSVKKPTCKNADGKITLNMIGGNAPYNIQWQNGDTGVMADSLKHGKYNVNITDALGCFYTDSLKVNDSTTLKDSFKITKTRCDTPTGKIITFPYGGPSPFKYKWDRSAKDTFAIFDSVRIGIYKLQIIDSNGCKFDTSALIEYDHTPTIRDSIRIERCDSANGKIFIKIDSVINPIQIRWDGVLDSTYAKTNLTAPRFVTISVIDSQKCVATNSIFLDEVPVSYPVLVKNPPPCGNNLGQLTVAINNPLSFIWSTGATSQSINNLAPGTYTVTITDTTGCKFVRTDSLAYSIAPTRNYTYTRSNCGRNDGQIKVVVGSNYGSFNYLWNKIPSLPPPVAITGSGMDSVIFISLDSGKYTFNITDAVGCNRKDTVYLKDSSAPKFNFNVTNSTCFNGTGKLKLIPTAGNPPFSYLWYNFTTKDSVTGLVSGSYTVTMADSRLCTRTDSALISYFPKPELNLIAVNSKCGPNNGQVSTNISFGKPPFTYIWSNGSTTKDLSGLSAGKYVLTITDSLGCQDIDSVFIAAEPLLQISTSKTVAFCDLNNGTATAIILGGKPPYTFNWDGSLNSLAVSGLDSGKHIFFIQDSNGCIKQDTQYIARVSKPVITQSIINDNCSYSVGQITTSVSGGQAPLSYLWSNGLGTIPSVNNVAAGSYTFSVTDNLGCQVTKSAVVGDTAGPVVSLVVTDATCGLSNGAINANVTSIKTPLSYYWNNVLGTTSKININGGKYVFKVVDNRGCIKLDSVLIDTVYPLTTTTNYKQASCNLNNSFIKIKAKGGTGAYTYTWGHTAVNVDSVFNLSPGNYRVTTSDIKGCVKVDSFVISQLGFPTITFNNTPAKCRASNGSIVTSISNFSGIYTYLWNTGETTSSLINKPANIYTLTISDGLGCIVNYSSTLISIGVDSIDLNITHPKCDLNNGKIKSIAYNTIGTKLYTWSPSAPNKDSISNLGAGNYSLTVTDSFCSFSTSKALVMASSPQISLTKQDASCGINNGRIFTNTVLGLAPLTYLWSNSAASVNLFNIDSGNYTVIVTDMNNCRDTASIYVPRIPMLVASFTTQKTTCGSSNGSIQTFVNGGKPTFNFNWSNGSTSINLSNLIAGTYVLTLSDNGNCTITENVVVDDRKKPIITYTKVDAVCGKANGKIDVSIVNGTFPFSYIWNTTATIQDLDNLATGFYRLTVTDSIGCKDSALIIIDAGTTPAVEWKDSTHSTCGLANGRLIIDLPRGVNPKVYTWSNGVVSDTLKNVASGIYYVTITDGRGCSIVSSIVVKTTTVPKLSFTTTNSYCLKSNGYIFSSIKNGSPGFRYKWNTGDTTAILSSKSKGLYTLIVTDTVGCIDTGRVQLLEDKNNVAATVQRFNLLCFNDNSGRVIITPSGGVHPYTYEVNSPSLDSNIYGLSATKYNYKVTDDKGCEYNDTFSLTEPSKLRTNLLMRKDLLCYGEPKGELEVAGVGGTYPYTYIWSGGLFGDKINGLAAGIHKLKTIDKNNCIDTVSYLLTQPTNIKVDFIITNNLCNGQSLASISLNVSQAIAPYSYKWSNGATTKNISTLKEGNYKLTISDGNGCVDIFTYTLIDPPTLQSGSIIPVGLKCKGIIDGELFVQGIGGVTPYTYSLDSGKTFGYQNKFMNLFPGNYYVIIKDKNDCKTYVSSRINDYPSFKIKASPKEATIQLDQSLMLGYTVIDGNPTWINKTIWRESDGLSCVDCESPIATPYTSRSYIVEVNYLEKCYAYDTVKINVIDDGNLFIPNAFTPGKSKYDQNNTFKLYGKNIVKAHMIIYDRIGAKMYETLNGNIDGWDGQFKGNNAPGGVYTYSLSITYLNKRIVEHRGTFTLLR
jgi:gliding motility-associated-like protein